MGAPGGGGGEGRKAPLDTMASSYAHAMERQALLPARLDGPAGLDNLQAKKNFSVSHLLDLEEAGDMVAAQADEGGGEPGRSLLESPGLTSGSDTPQQDSKWRGHPTSIPPRGRGAAAALPTCGAAGGAGAGPEGAPAGKRPDEPPAGPRASLSGSPTRSCPRPPCPRRGRHPAACENACFPPTASRERGNGELPFSAVPRSSGPAPRRSVSLRGTRRKTALGAGAGRIGLEG